MSSIYNKADNEIIISRINKLTPESQGQWGKMTVDQMLSHCQAPMDFAFGKTPMKANFLMQLLGKMIKGKMLKSKEFKKNSPTAPAFIRTEKYDFEDTKNGLIERINYFSDLGQGAIKTTKHPFFGEMTYDEWSQLHTMHLDHHLRQFGV
ncbi:DUF1569 domain-containing protein [Flavobacterium wongokense]|uniref:DUF1569 domain-containing protein n=1 Tax=Flavobacterium wongokense TaxID=2910674 RepID=UPI001F46DBD2|nr:DUF1569 domain-containing protein [Flavobacterium sp. WG47]MCF6132928.1 DUF1569 domain-containing protein [Flavobacterium sp. WG47]